MRRVLISLFAILSFVGLATVYVIYYRYIHAQSVSGEIIEVERVSNPSAIIGGSVPTSQMFSFAVAIKDKSGEIYTASAEDRQWAIAKKGMCVEAVFYPYPFWDLEKSGTYHGARLKRLYECGSTN